MYRVLAEPKPERSTVHDRMIRKVVVQSLLALLLLVVDDCLEHLAHLFKEVWLLQLVLGMSAEGVD